MLALSMLAACATEDDQTSVEESPLLNGSPTAARPEVMQIFVGPFACSATMLSSSTFLTAAHCINFSPVFFGGTAHFANGTSQPITRIFAQGGGAVGSDDMAVGKLAGSVSGITPATIATAQPSNTLLTVLGYGCTTSRSPSCSPSGRTFISYFYNGGDSFNYAPGDSGGPTFVGGLNDGGPIVRVTSAFNGNTGADIGANAVTYRSQLLALSSALNSTGVAYRAQVQSQGWQAAGGNGSVSGTIGQSLRLEGLQVWTQNPGESVCYTGYVQDVGWQPEVCDGNLAGTVGQAKRMEAIKIRHVGGNGFVQYRVNLQGIGWQDWRSNNAVAGTTGQSRRIEAIQIQFN